MERKDFILSCGYACLGILGFSSLLQSCSLGSFVLSQVEENRLTLSKSVFVMTNTKGTTYKKYIITKAEGIQYPIVIYRKAEDNYTALLLRCSHQGAELTVNGEIMTCSAHGSEFGIHGDVLQGPAEDRLRSFTVQSDAQNIYIHLT